ncbi:MAG: hypothetical protein H7X94_06675 [Vallitaleaceae bacterium]|nr:hypothetical protein [Vallitaleaceae bacterium]
MYNKLEKVVRVNLKDGMPTVEAAILKMKNAIATQRGQGGKAVLFIHGYGSSGVGGGIKIAVRKWLSENGQGIVLTYVGGEQWLGRKREILGLCKSLERFEREITNNEGITVVILK